MRGRSSVFIVQSRWEAEMFSPEVNSVLENVRQTSTRKFREEPEARKQQQKRRKEKEARRKKVLELEPITEKFESLIMLGALYLKVDGTAADEAARTHPMNGEESTQE